MPGNSFNQYLFTINLLLSYILNANGVNITFDRDKISVLFQPYLRTHDTLDSYSEADLINLLGVIFKRFSNIESATISESSLNSSIAFIPTAVAKFNQNVTSMSSKTENQQKPTVTKVILKYSDDTDKSLFSEVLRIAEKANSIHPGTVEYLMGFPTSNNYPAYLKQLEIAQTHLNSVTGNTYRLATLLPLSSCGRWRRFDDGVIPVLEKVHFVSFNYVPEEKEYDSGVESTLRKLSWRFKKCKKKINSLNLTTEVGFSVSWSDTDYNGKQNLSALVYFWEKMNEWAIKTITKVTFKEAFDQPGKDNNSVLSTQGWWRLKLSSEMGNSSRFVFEEKASLLPRNPQPKSDPDEGKKRWDWEWIAITFAVAVVCLFVGVATGKLVVYAKLVRARQEIILTKEELKCFFNGAKTFHSSSSSSDYKRTTVSKEGVLADFIEDAPYNAEYELDSSQYYIDEDSLLGTGAFGSVCFGRVLKNGKELPVAVKSIKRGAPTTALKGLMSEIKVMSYLGQNENIVSLLGAYTKELRQGKVLVFTELCGLGSLETYLRKYAKPFADGDEEDVDDNERMYMNLYVNEDGKRGAEHGIRNTLTESRDLLRWSLEIARGMEFLSSKHVVHADLATRNVLLTKDKTAKISDFGLSRRLYDYTNYVKQQQEPLPWRWMAPESLLRLEFNEKTDVWAYGITLWEIYSFGDLPYAGLSWNTSFASDLSKGLRLVEPRCNYDNLFTTVMLKCWNNDPTKRPSFSELNDILTNLSSLNQYY